MAYVYRHIRLDTNQPFYIGISNIADIDYKRANLKSGRNKYWNRIIDKTDYRVEILFDDIDFDYAKEKEIEFIKLYGRSNSKYGTLCNLTDGGEGTTGAILSDEHKNKISLATKGKVLSGETKRKIGIANKNMSDETRKKLSDINKGNTNWVGRKHKESSKLLNAYSKGLKILDENNFVCHFGCTSASIFLGVSSSSIRNQLCGFRKNTLNLKLAQIKNQKMSELKK
jgi:uncharacterized protein (DUF488 family)